MDPLVDLAGKLDFSPGSVSKKKFGDALASPFIILLLRLLVPSSSWQHFGTTLFD